jgi:hypothetical protein
MTSVFDNCGIDVCENGYVISFWDLEEPNLAKLTFVFSELEDCYEAMKIHLKELNQ